ncbi:MAG: hypothetical protein CMH60_05285 [Myxococcales bacterium]|nr:hypothetical protein [Myxococcales bacterium]
MDLLKHRVLPVFLVSVLALPVAASDGLVVKGEAAIVKDNIPLAKERAVEKALRNAVEQSLGTLVQSETVTQNYTLLSDKIYSRASGYVERYELMDEERDSGVYTVKVKAWVAKKALADDAQAVLSVLRAKNEPRVLLMLAEQNVNQGSASFWWGDKTFSTNLDVVENQMIDVLGQKGVRFVDRQALQGKIQIDSAVTQAAPSDLAIKSFAGRTGAEYVVVGKAVATDGGPILGSKMHSVRANISLRVIELANGSIISTTTLVDSVGHIDPITGGTKALKKVATRAADDLLGKLLKHWQSELGGITKVALEVSNLKFSQVRKLIKTLENDVQGVEAVHQRSFQGGAVSLDLNLKGSAILFAEMLEEAGVAGLKLSVVEVVGNTIRAEAQR